jgi:iron complex outermembrane recepter protein
MWAGSLQQFALPLRAHDRLWATAAILCAVGLSIGTSRSVLAQDVSRVQSREAEQTLPPPPSSSSEAPASPVDELEQLLTSAVQVPAMQQEVTTVSGQVSTVGKSPAAVFVITQEMIRHSGATCVPEVLRMAPGIQVARINSNHWAITARGFNADIATVFSTNNKLLVLIDGRTVYTPFFSGTYWDVQDLLLEDVERIEVIRGPGATIWGANAVNGVINVITKRAADTQGGFAQAGGGTPLERGFGAVRVGGQSGDDTHYRVYAKAFDRGSSFNWQDTNTDDWHQGRGGFRTDWTPSECDLLTLQGEMYDGSGGFLNTAYTPRFKDYEQVHGGHMLARWTRTFDDDHDTSLQMYYDRADRDNNLGFLDQEFNTYDIDYRYHCLVAGRHNVVSGLGYRIVKDRIQPLIFPPAVNIPFDPVERSYATYSAFVQDEIALTDDFFLTIGSKLQHNDFTGWEVQPTIRTLYSPEESWAAWGAVSRAVRTPSRIEHDSAIATATPFLDFVPTFESEEVIAYELGYRTQPEPWFSWDIAVFFNKYRNLSSLRLTPVTLLPIFNANDNTGEGYGVEVFGQLDVTRNWHLYGQYSFLQLQIHPGPGAIEFLGSSGTGIEWSSPHNQAYVMSSHKVTRHLECDFIGRYIDEVPFLRIPSYCELDIRLAWRVTRCTEIAVVGQNLLDSHHIEYRGTPSDEIRRGVYGSISHTW